MKKYEIMRADCRALNIERRPEDVIVTDPPFNIGYKYKSYKDRMAEDEYYEMLAEVIGDRPAVVVHYPEQLHKLSIKLGRAPERVVSWVYNSNTGRQHRDIAFYGVTPDFKKVRQPYKNPNDKRIKQRIADGKLGAKLYDWWNINQVKNISKEKRNHPCQMPLKALENIVGILPDDARIIDPFMGTGTTGEAALRGGREFVGVELDPEYFKIAQDRLEKVAAEE